MSPILRRSSMASLTRRLFQHHSHPRLQRPMRQRRPRPSWWLALLLVSGALAFSSAQPALAIDAPTLLSPADLTTSNTGNYPPLGIPEFSWSAVSGANTYRVQWSSDIGFATIPFEAVTVNTTYTPNSAGPFSDGT